MSIVIRRNPIREMTAFQDAMDRFFDETWRNFESNADSTLALDIHETSEAYVLMSNIPGVKTEDIDITVHDGVLSISAELPKINAGEGVRVRMQERPFGTYSRSIRLPRAIDSDAVNAVYENGVLMLTLPKTADAQPRQIPIKIQNALSDSN